MATIIIASALMTHILGMIHTDAFVQMMSQRLLLIIKGLPITIPLGKVGCLVVMVFPTVTTPDGDILPVNLHQTEGGIVYYVLVVVAILQGRIHIIQVREKKLI
jgi:hypothetical protein